MSRSTSGYGGVYSLFSGDERLAKVPPGGSLWVFAVKQLTRRHDAEKAISQDGGDPRRRRGADGRACGDRSCRGMTQPAIPMQAQIDHGKSTYAEKCSHCHGPNMMNSGTITPDLRAFPDDKTRFVTTVKTGKNNRMPPWGDILNDDDIAGPVGRTRVEPEEAMSELSAPASRAINYCC